MESGCIMKLRSMSATIGELKDVYVMKMDAEGGDYKIHLDRCLVLRSYNSVVAIYAYGELYLLPRYDYSVTTWRHVHAFIQDYCHAISDGDARTIRKRAKWGEMGYHFASHYVIMNGLRPGKRRTY